MDVVYIGLVLAICVVLIVTLRFGEAFCLLRLKMLEIKSKGNLETERLTAEVEKYKRQLQVALYNNRRRNLQLDALHLVWCGDYSDYALHRYVRGEITAELVEEAKRNTAQLEAWFKRRGGTTG